MKIIETFPGASNFHLFEELPKLIYSSDSHRTKQHENLNKEYINACFVLTIDGIPKARVALYENPYLLYQGMKAGCVGNYECVEDLNVSSTLLKFVIERARERQNNFLIGPMNGSTWDSYRFNHPTNHPYFLLEPCHHQYYPQQFIKSGFTPIANYFSSKGGVLPDTSQDALNLQNTFRDMNVNIRTIDTEIFDKELENLYPFIQSAFKNNFLYSPIRWEEFRKKYIEALQIVNSEFVLIAEDSAKNIIGFIFCYQDLLNTREKSLVVKTLARDANKKWSGLGNLLVNTIIQRAKYEKYQSIIHAFMIEEGASTRLSKKAHGEIIKRYSLYGVTLS